MSAAKALGRPHLSVVNPDPMQTLVPEGEYVVAFSHCETGVVFNSKKIFGHFTIDAPDDVNLDGLPLLRVWNCQKGKHLARSSNLALDYMQVTGRRAPSHGLKPEHFLKDCRVRVDVVTVKRSSDSRVKADLPKDCHYSKIDRIAGLSMGCPPCRQKIKRQSQPLPELEPEHQQEQQQQHQQGKVAKAERK